MSVPTEGTPDSVRKKARNEQKCKGRLHQEECKLVYFRA